MANTSALLRSAGIFEGLSGRELTQIGALMKEEWFNAGEDIITKDGKGGRFYVIVEGRAKVLVGKRTTRTVGPGGFFGEMAIIDGGAPAATVRAETAVKTLWLSRLSFLSLLEENWPLTKKVLADLCARIRASDREHTS